MTGEESPLVSIVIPYYNGQAFIGDAIESIQDQTYTEWELLVVDDGSTDDGKAVIGEYTGDERISLLVHETNQGIAVARNTAIRASNGKYIAFLDQDDTWKKTWLEECVAAAEQTENIGLVQTGLMKKGGDRGEGLRDKGEYSEVDDRALARDLFLGRKPFYSASTIMISRRAVDTLGLMDERLTRWDDQEMWIRILSSPEFKTICVSKPLVTKRGHSGQATQDDEEVWTDWMRLHHIVLANHEYLWDCRNEHLSLMRGTKARNAWVAGDRFGAIYHYLASLYWHPANWKSMVGLGLSPFGRVGWRLYQQLGDWKNAVAGSQGR